MPATATKLPDDDTNDKANKPGGLANASDLPVSPLSKEKGKQDGGPKAAIGAGLSPTEKLPKGMEGMGGTGIEKGDTEGQKANKVASKAIDKAAAGGKSGGGTDKALKAVDKIDKESPEAKAKREGQLSNTALKGAGAAAGAALGGTAGAQIGAKVGEEVSKHKMVFIAIAFGILAIAMVPIFIIVYIIQNPWNAVKMVLTNSKIREFGIDVAQAFAKGALEASIRALTYTGEVDYKGPNTAVAATPSTIEPGTTLDRLSQIDWRQAQYQTLDNAGCVYELRLQLKVNAEGRTRYVPKEVFNKRTREVIPLNQLGSNQAASYCIQKQYPIFNMMARQPVTREINQLANIHLDYAGKKDTEEFRGSREEVNRYVFNKTIGRITPTTEETIDFSSYQGQITEFQNNYKEAVRAYNAANPDNKIPYKEEKADLVAGINKMYEDMADGTSPYDISVGKYLNIPERDSYTPQTNSLEKNLVRAGIANTICPFAYGFLDLGNTPRSEAAASNARKAIESRLASTERGAIKVLTMADTRNADQLSNVENNATIAQQDNWASSTSYQLDVYNELRGVEQNPEATSTRAYNAKQTDLVSDPSVDLLLQTCTFLTSENRTLLLVGDTLIQPSYQLLKLAIVNNSQGVFNSIDDFGLKEIITSYVRTGSVTAVSGLESGPDNYNRQAAGFRQLMNDYFLRIGGRFLTDREARDIAIQSEDTRRTEEKQGGMGYRLFANENIRSARSIIAQNTITPKTAMTAAGSIFKEVLNPLRSLANIHSSALYYGFGQHNKAFAATINGDQYLKIDTAGIPPQDFASFDMLDNATVIEDIKASRAGTDNDRIKLAHYDECFKKKIPTSQYFQLKTIKFTDLNDDALKASIRAKYPQANAVQWFVFFPEWHRGVLKDANDNITPVTRVDRADNDADSEFMKFYDCKVILQLAQDFNNEEYKLPIRYRMYTYYNTLLDQMVSLSNDEDNQSIYAKTSTPTGPVGGAPNADADTSGTPCPNEPGITTSNGPNLVGGVAQTYGPGGVPANKIMVCDVAAPAGGVIDINVSLASQLNKLLKDAQAAGIIMGGGGFRSYEEQVALYNQNCSGGSCSPPTAEPGTSNHEKGLAIDFNCNGGSAFNFGGSPCFNWMVQHAEEYGLKNLPSEAWHWSVTGN